MLYIANQPFDNIDNLIKQLICEIFMFFSSIVILIIGLDEKNEYFYPNVTFKLGWSIISFLVLILVVEIIIDIKINL